jgi:hypothetical protein
MDAIMRRNQLLVQGPQCCLGTTFEAQFEDRGVGIASRDESLDTGAAARECGSYMKVACPSVQNIS